MTAEDWQTWGQHYLDPVQYLLYKDDTGPVSVEIDAHPNSIMMQ